MKSFGFHRRKAKPLVRRIVRVQKDLATYENKGSVADLVNALENKCLI